MSRRVRARGRALDAAPAAGAQWLEELSTRSRDPEFVARLAPDDLLVLLYGQCLYFGQTRDAETGEALARLFARAAEVLPAEDRLEVLDRVCEAVRAGTSGVLALLPFLQHECSIDVVEAAASTFATLAPLDGGDPLTGPRLLRALIEHAERSEARVGLLAGLLQLGDRRVRALLRGAWRALSPDEREQLLARRSALAHLGRAEFLLDWLEDGDEGSAPLVAAALARLPSESGGRLLDLERKFPEHVGDRPEIVVLGECAPSEYAAREAERFRWLASRPGVAPLMPAVLDAWGIPR